MSRARSTGEPFRRIAGLALVLALCTPVAAAVASTPSAQREDPSVKETDDPLVLQRLGVLYIRENRPREAARALSRAVDLYPENGETHMWLGLARFMQQEFELAEEEYLKSLAYDPGLTDAHNYLGLLYTETGEWERAIAEFETALDDPAYPRASRRSVHINLGRLYLDRGRPDDALPHLRQAVELVPRQKDAAAVLSRLLLARTLRALDRHSEAVSTLEPVLEIEPDNADAHLQLGLSYHEMGRADVAREHLENVLRLVPGSRLSERALEVLGGDDG